MAKVKIGKGVKVPPPAPSSRCVIIPIEYFSERHKFPFKEMRKYLNQMKPTRQPRVIVWSPKTETKVWQSRPPQKGGYQNIYKKK